MIIETKRGLLLATKASLVMPDRITAEWSHRSVTPNKAFLYLAAKYVEADKPNANGHMWSFEDLQKSQSSIVNSPINMMHDPHHIVGVMIDQEIRYPKGKKKPVTKNANAFWTTTGGTVEATTTGTATWIDLSPGIVEAYDYSNPYIDVLGVVWSFYYPKTVDQLRALNESGQLFVSMECISDTVTRVDSDGTTQEFPFMGGDMDNYEKNDNTLYVKLNNPHFLGAGLVVPPARPGWQGAEVKELLAASMVADPDLYDQISEENPDLEPKDWEMLMLSLQVHAQKVQ